MILLSSAMVVAILMVFFLVLNFVQLEGNLVFPTEVPDVEREKSTEVIQVSYSNESVVSEVQHTICSIKTEEIVAKAQSTASRILTGVCTKEEMNKVVKNLERNIINKLEQIQNNLINLIESKFKVTNPKSDYKVSRPAAFRTIDYLFGDDFFKNHT